MHECVVCIITGQVKLHIRIVFVKAVREFFIRVSLSEPDHMRSTVKSVFLLDCLYVCPSQLCDYIVNTEINH